MGDFKEDPNKEELTGFINPGPNAFHASKHRGARKQRVSAALSKRLIKAGIKKPPSKKQPAQKV
jgi:hypothetical protein